MGDVAGTTLNWEAHRFFASRVEGPPGDARAVLEGEEAHHAARVLRLRPRDPVVILDGTGCEYAGELLSVDARLPRCEVACRAARPSPGEPAIRIELLQALPKGDKMEYVVEKGTEAGISRFVPVLTERTIPRLEAAGLERRLARWRRIASEAAKQCRRGRRPEVAAPAGVAAAVNALRERGAPVLLLWERAERSLKAALRSWPLPGARELGLVVGPEGGFGDEEAGELASLGAVPVKLGERILRTESAGPIAAAIVLYELESGA